MRSLSQIRPMRTLGSWNQFDDIFNEFDSSFFNSPALSSAFSPAMDVEEKEGVYLITVDLPGIKKEDIEIHVSERTLTISGERVKEKKGQGHYFERSYGQFARSITLPENVKADDIEAEYEDGELKLLLPKAELAKAKTIQVQSGHTGGLLKKFFGTGSDSGSKTESKGTENKSENKMGDAQKH